MKFKAIYFLAVFLFVSCSSEPKKYEDIATHPNYYDSCNISFLKEIKPIRLAESLKNQFNHATSNSYMDSLIMSNPYLVNGSQNINIFNELEKSHQLNKPILIHFNGIGCVNCRKMEQMILDDPKVSSFIDEAFHFISLNLDDRTKLPEDHWVNNPLKNTSRPLKRLGMVNSAFQIMVSRSGSQPTFIALDIDRALGLTGYTTSKDDFLGFLKKTAEKYKEKRN